MGRLDSTTGSMVMNLSKLLEIAEDGGACQVAVHEVTKSRTQLSDRTTTSMYPGLLSGPEQTRKSCRPGSGLSEPQSFIAYAPSMTPFYISPAPDQGSDVVFSCAVLSCSVMSDSF